MPPTGSIEAGGEFASLRPLLAPNSIAIIGASTDPIRIGGRPIAYMNDRKYAGTILPVNPNRSEIQGHRSYPSVAALPMVPDLGIVGVAASQAIDALEELGRHGTKAAIVFSAGFGEVDQAGLAAQDRMAAVARRYGMRLLGPNCLGLFNGAAGYYATHSGALQSGWPIQGRIGVVSQSGAFATHIFMIARNRGIGTSFVVMTGNEADVTIGEVIGWMAEHDGIDVIAVYAEGFRDVDRLLAALKAARAARKPVIMMKVGSTARGSAAAMSHTAAIAGDDMVVDAILAEFGVIRAETTEQLLDVAHLATRRIYPVRNSLGVITVSGGGGVLATDAAARAGLEMPDMPVQAQQYLKQLVPFCAPRNPVDCTAQSANDPTLIGKFAEAVARDGNYASILAFMSMLGGWRASVINAQLTPVMQAYRDRLWVLSVIASQEQVAAYESDGYICIEDPTRAIVAIAAMHRLGAAFNAAEPVPPPDIPTIAIPDTVPTEIEAKAILAGIGIAAPPERICTSAEAAVRAATELGFPVVLKLVAPELRHKSDVGGVILNVGDAEAVRQGFATLMQRAAGMAVTGILVSRQLVGVECIMGVHRDPTFGSVAVFGLGGIYVETLTDVAVHRCPFGIDVAERMIRGIRGAPLLLGARGRPPVDVPALARMLSNLSVLAHQQAARINSIDINPVIAMPEGQGAYAVDALFDLSSAE